MKSTDLGSSLRGFYSETEERWNVRGSYRTKPAGERFYWKPVTWGLDVQSMLENSLECKTVYARMWINVYRVCFRFFNVCPPVRCSNRIANINVFKTKMGCSRKSRKTFNYVNFNDFIEIACKFYKKFHRTMFLRIWNDPVQFWTKKCFTFKILEKVA